MKIPVISLFLFALWQQTYASSFDVTKFNSIKQQTVELNANTYMISHTTASNGKILDDNVLNALRINNKLINSYLNKITINTWMDNNSVTESFSNGSQENCSIDIEYEKDVHPLLLENIDKDILFISAHELSHCILSKKVFTEKLHWLFSINSDEEKRLNRLIQNETNKNIKKMKTNNSKYYALPLVVYHEMFADTFASLWLFSSNQLTIEDIERIKNIRKKQYEIEEKSTAYVSFLPLQNLLDIISKNPTKFKNISLKEINEITLLLIQKNFINYLLNKE